MQTFLRSFLLLLLLFSGLLAIGQNKSISFDNGFYYLNNEKVFLKGIGYEAGAIPGQLPWEREFDESLLRFDMDRIEKAGFNAIRTWSAFTEQELNIIQDYDIFIIMGIWVDPHGDFSHPGFVANAESIVEEVVSYSKNYDNIIGYLIMNEPLPKTIFDAGYHNSVELWTGLINIIHDHHQGIPVSMAHYPANTFIDPSVFDFSAYNLYIYNPVTVNLTHGYAAFVEYLGSLREDEAPLLITEFGLSVSPSGQGNWGYGGNTINEQTEGDLFMYRALIDGGAGGAFMFNYSDGWWKAGNEYVHDDHAEEWFGLIEYENINDQWGTPRPVWHECSTYNRAIITSPKNGSIYNKNIPLEIFSMDTIQSLQVLEDDILIFSHDLPGTVFIDTIPLNDNFEDHVLLFRFSDSSGQIMKEEEICFMVVDEALIMPELKVSTSIDEWNQPTLVEILVEINHNPLFAHSELVDYATYWHEHFIFGDASGLSLPSAFSNYNFSYYESISEDIPVVTFPAGYEIHYGDFSKRIYDQQMLIYEGYIGITADDYAPSMFPEVIIYPNPAESYFCLSFPGKSWYGSTFILYDILGNEHMRGTLEAGMHYQVHHLESGIYLIKIDDQDSVNRVLKLFVR